MKKIPIRHIVPSFQELSTAERFKIRRVEDILGGSHLVHDLHRHDFFFILAVKQGQGSHEIDFTPYAVEDHSVFLLRPGQVHQLSLEAGCTGYLLEFNMEFYNPQGKSSDPFLRKAGNKNHCVPKPDRFNKIQNILAAMFHEFTAQEEGYQEVIKANLAIFFIEFARQSAHLAGTSTAAGSYIQERFDDFLALLDKHIVTHKRVSEYTEMMNLSPFQLNEITKKSIGKTASDLINDHILLEAKKYLLATTNQVKVIADHLGFEDPSYFIRFFKKHMGQSPEAFRQHPR